MKSCNSQTSMAESATSFEDGMPPPARHVPQERPDLAALYEAAMANMMGLHSQVLQALRTNQPYLDKPMDEKAYLGVASASFNIRDSWKNSPSPTADSLKDEAASPTSSKQLPSGLAAGLDISINKKEASQNGGKLGELSAHHGVVLELDRDNRDESKAAVRQDWISRLVHHGLFDFCASTMIFVNSFIIAVETQWLATNSRSPFVLEVLNHACSAFFFTELVLRVIAQRSDFCLQRRGRGWNIFDTVLVLVSIVDTVASAAAPVDPTAPQRPGAEGPQRDQTMDVLQAVRILKMLRIARIFRVFRFSRELSLMALMIIDSMRSLMWALLMLLLMIFVFAVWFTTNATFYLRPHADLSREDWFEHLVDSPVQNVVDVRNNFGTLEATTYSLLRSMLGGINWGILCDMLLAMDTISPMLFIFYVLFALLAVLNIVTGVFVDNAVAAAKTQREFIIEKEREVKEKYVAELQDLFLEMDEDASGTLTAQEMQQLVKDPKMSAYFSALGFEAHDCIRLFTLLDTDGSGSVDIEEFLDGCLRLKGMARSIDVHFIMVLINRLQRQLNGVEKGNKAVMARLNRQSKYQQKKSTSLFLD